MKSAGCGDVWNGDFPDVESVWTGTGHALQVGGIAAREKYLTKKRLLRKRRKKRCPDTRDNFFIIAYDQTMNSEKTRLRKSFGARRSIRHKVPKIFKIFENSKFSRFYIRISKIHL